MHSAMIASLGVRSSGLSKAPAAAPVAAAITPIRAMYRRARQLGEIHANPTSGVTRHRLWIAGRRGSRP
jgi:hypothetical protein